MNQASGQRATPRSPGASPAEPLRILITALGGEGGGVLMNWLVAAARANGFTVQATSVPGVAQRTGSTSYYLEIIAGEAAPVLNLVPMPGRVEIVLASELVEAARVIEAGFVSPDRTTLIASSSRFYAIAEKIQMADGRYDVSAISTAAKLMARHSLLLDLQQMAADNNTFVSATLFGALAASGALPWPADASRAVLGSGDAARASLRGFDAAASAMTSPAAQPVQTDDAIANDLDQLIELATDRLSHYQDSDYADQYRQRMNKLITAASDGDPAQRDALTEAARRLANWMAYEDIARVADLKTSAKRFAQVRENCAAGDDQIVHITEYLKPRAQEIADMLPARWGKPILRRLESGKRLPFLGQGRQIRSSAAWGYWLLRATAGLKSIRRRSMRFASEQAEIDQWIDALTTVLPRAPVFARALAELPRVRKGYSDTLARGLAAYRSITDAIVKPAIAQGNEVESAPALQTALDAAFADDKHQALNNSINETVIHFRPRQEATRVH